MFVVCVCVCVCVCGCVQALELSFIVGLVLHVCNSELSHRRTVQLARVFFFCDSFVPYHVHMCLCAHNTML